jgi:S1-C subfamily serine protease
VNPLVPGSLALSLWLALPAADREARRVEVIGHAERSVASVVATGASADSVSGAGTAVALSRDGLLLTAAHVVLGAERILVRPFESDPTPARLVFMDRAADLALLRLEARGLDLHPATFGDSSRLRKGDTLYVIGNPSGLERSLSVGVVSGRHPAGRILGGAVEAELIQTDAAMNPGNSGGPMFDSSGNLVGLAQLILSESGGFEGLGFGLAINDVKRVLGLDPCVWLGFSAYSLDPQWSDALNLRVLGAALVQIVEPGSSAALAGLRAGTIRVAAPRGRLLLGGDVVIAIDGVPYQTWVRSSAPTRVQPGARHVLTLTIMRAGSLIDIPLPVVHRPTW